MTPDSVRVITTCTSRKVAQAEAPAERLYTGEQHRRLMQGVDELRRVRPVETWIISAKAGLVPGDELLSPYDMSFSRLGRHELRRHAESLGIPTAIRRLVRQPRSLTLLLAGNEYFDAARLDEPVEWAAPTIALVSPRSVVQLPRHPRLRPLAVGQAEAKHFSLPLTLLKGELTKRLLLALASDIDPEVLFQECDSLVGRPGAPPLVLAS